MIISMNISDKAGRKSHRIFARFIALVFYKKMLISNSRYVILNSLCDSDCNFNSTRFSSRFYNRLNLLNRFRRNIANCDTIDAFVYCFCHPAQYPRLRCVKAGSAFILNVIPIPVTMALTVMTSHEDLHLFLKQIFK